MSDWIAVCDLNDIAPDTGVCAALSGEQVALFRLGDTEQVFAVSNYDPFGKANVLSRGIIGSIGEQLVVASPLYKQHFDLATGVCLEDGEVSIKTFQVKVENDQILLAA
ncbi:MAG: nitrite reductase small subunit NirD [Saccharospirillaceae bacterium]|jgi:nitrite reductase (NADH) small subunit|nr:nitrite reductase small subunit [Thalassolituus sp. HI0120]MCH2039128.1 nitrite reductase small subunit NirD [Saccharospirillaceae bacterium]